MMVINFQGEEVEVLHTGKYTTSEKGLVEVWVFINGYHKPLPVFTEWFIPKTLFTLRPFGYPI